MMRFRFLALAALIAAAPAAAADLSRLTQPWPTPDSVSEDRGETVSFASHSPFVLEDVGAGDTLDPPTRLGGRLFVPAEASRAEPVPAVVMLHGSAGIVFARELAYGQQYSAMGVAALAVDTFGARRDIATSYTDRVLRITETMMVADAYAALRYLATRPEIDPKRIAVLGYSYGALASLLTAYAQVAERFAPSGERFAAHITYYGPCLARFEDRRATGAPVLMLSAALDKVSDPVRCAEAADELRAGGAPVSRIVYAGAYHQWDGSTGSMDSPVHRGMNLSSCRFTVEQGGAARDARTGVAMSNVFWRRIILGLCLDRDGYQQARNDAVRLKSNAEVGGFLARAFAAGAPSPSPPR